MTQVALLEHATPDGGVHLDLMFERTSNADRRLVTFRLPRAFALTPGTSAHAQRLQDHRAIYLDLEGPISGNRGSVRRLGRWPGRIHIDSPEVFNATIDLAPPLRILALPDQPGFWSLVVQPL